MKSCNHYSILRDKPSILRILAEYGIEVKRVGRKYWARCVFHNERAASMCVYAEQEKFYCFSCQRGGDSYDLLSALSGRPLREILRERGIELPPLAVLQKQRERAKIIKQFEAKCLSCWKKLVGLLHKTYAAEREHQVPTDENLEYLADIYYLRGIIEQLLSKLEDSDIYTRLAALSEAKQRGLY